MSADDQRKVDAFARALRECPEPYRSVQAAGSIWCEGYISGAIATEGYVDLETVNRLLTRYDRDDGFGVREFHAELTKELTHD